MPRPRTPKLKKDESELLLVLGRLMTEYELSRSDLARGLKVDPMRVTRLFADGKERLVVSRDTATRLGLLFGTGTDFWLELKERDEAKAFDMSGEARKIRREVKPLRKPDGD